MKRPARTLCLLALLAALSLPAPLEAGWNDLIKDLGRVLEPGALSGDKIVQGLKEALEVGAGNAVSLVSKTNGYYGNPDIRIPLPGSVQKVERIARAAGYGSTVDAFHQSMNRAAEQAAPRAKELFWEAVRGMTFDDARDILEGPDNAATAYLRDKTGARLAEMFKPVVHDTMSRVEVTRQYQDLTSRISSLPFVGQLGNLDLDGYVTDRALDGLFYMLAEEEKKIRTDPAARVTDLLKEVFGNAAAQR